MNSAIRKLGVPILIAAFVVTAVASATQAITVHRHRAFPTSGPWSLQMAVDGDLADNGFNGARFSLSHQTSQFNALRINLGLIHRDHLDDNNGLFNSDRFDYAFTDPETFDINGANISIQQMFLSPTNGNARFFWGLGPLLSVSDVGGDVLVYDADPFYGTTVVQANSSTLIGAGIELSLGMEFFLGPSVSMLAEYGLLVQNRWYIIEYDRYDNYNRRVTEIDTYNDGLNIDASQIRIGLAVHF